MANGNVLKTAFPVFNGYAPKGAPKALPVSFDFSVVGTQDYDLFNENAQDIIDFVQSVYVDNATNPNALTLLFGATRQRIIVPAGQSGMYPVLTIDQVRFTLSSTVNAAATGMIILLNVPMPAFQFGGFTGTIATTPVARGVYTDAAVLTVTAGGNSQTLFAANANRLGYIIGNPTNAAEPISINFGNPATSAGAIDILPGDSIQSGTAVSSQQITITAPTTGHAFYAKELA